MRLAALLTAVALPLAACETEYVYPPDSGPGFADADGFFIDAQQFPFPDANPLDMCGFFPTDCPFPVAGKASLCGNVIDSETSMPALNGPVGYRLAVHPAAAFADDPSALPVGTLETDACGRFALTDVTVPAGGLVALVVDDASGAAADSYVTTAIFLATAPNARIENINAFATRETSDDAWSSSSGIAGGSFAERGAYVPIFIDTLQFGVAPFRGRPTADVVVTRAGAGIAEDDYYFSNQSRTLRSTVNAGLTTTGSNGAAVVVSGSAELTEYGGLGGGLPTNCTWGSTLGAVIPGVIVVQEKWSECL